MGNCGHKLGTLHPFPTYLLMLWPLIQTQTAEYEAATRAQTYFLLTHHYIPQRSCPIVLSGISSRLIQKDSCADQLKYTQTLPVWSIVACTFSGTFMALCVFLVFEPALTPKVCTVFTLAYRVQRIWKYMQADTYIIHVRGCLRVLACRYIIYTWM